MTTEQPERPDRRVSRTRRLLTEALIALAMEKGYDAITIRDITERADIGYATFFRHYAAKDALLADVLEAFLDELLQLALPGAKTADPADIGRLVFEHAQKNSELYRLLLASTGSGILNRVIEVGTEGFLNAMKPRPGSSVPAEVAANHLISSFLALIHWWLRHDMPYTPQRMGEMYADLIYVPARTIAFEA